MARSRPVVAVLAPAATDASAVVRNLLGGYRLVLSSDPGDFARALADVSCGVAVVRGLPSELVSSLPDRNPLPSLILVSPPSDPADTEEDEADLPVELLVERLLPADVDRSLRRTVTAASIEHLLRKLRSAVYHKNARFHRWPMLQKGLGRALREPGWSVVAAVAKEVGRSDRTLDRDWKAYRATDPLDVELKAVGPALRGRQHPAPGRRSRGGRDLLRGQLRERTRIAAREDPECWRMITSPLFLYLKEVEYRFNRDDVDQQALREPHLGLGASIIANGPQTIECLALSFGGAQMTILDRSIRLLCLGFLLSVAPVSSQEVEDAEWDCEATLKEALKDEAHVDSIFEERARYSDPPAVFVLDGRFASMKEIQELMELGPVMLGHRLARTRILRREAAEEVVNRSLEKNLVCAWTKKRSTESLQITER